MSEVDKLTKELNETPEEFKEIQMHFIKNVIWVAYYIFCFSALVAVVYKTVVTYGTMAGFTIAGMSVGLILLIYAIIYAFMEGIIE